MEKWADTPTNSSRLLKLLRVGGQNFADWLSAAGYSPTGPTSAQLAKDWLKTWSLDLAQLAEDHNMRNEVSYRPQRLLPVRDQTNTVDVIKTLVDFWRACEPSSLERFSLLDLHLLRRALEFSYQRMTGTRPSGSRFMTFINSALANLGMPSDNPLTDFLLRRQQPLVHPLLREAKKQGKPQNGVAQPLPIVARAILLLRLASAATDDMLSTTSISKTDLEFWLNRAGEELGLWDTGAPPDEMTDLWADVRPALDAADAWCDMNGAICSLFKAKTALGNELYQIEQFERIGFWATGL